MKVSVLGYSGSGKSTLAEKLGQIYSAEVLHLDRVQFLPGWEDRPREEKADIIRDFLDSHSEWIIDGNYKSSFIERRLEESDLIILMLFGRVNCLWRVAKRFIRYKGRSRPDVTEGCNEKLDAEFVRWILRDGRTKDVREFYKAISEKYPDKTVVIRNQYELDSCCEALCRRERI